MQLDAENRPPKDSLKLQPLLRGKQKRPWLIPVVKRGEEPYALGRAWC